ncbi:hypothetical protein Val02_40290 [Virgisporangium aliadipatigenens]|uniref:Ribosomal RNA small subunit methyltransferase G n=1 Tax=Virgisporangium aliadipatigenens TaxID=741659 RepID=A0A8J4DRU8_9ACTN|nr:16S rRNA (guanine(527)-N(7))-methyltransferase RsmG [Virgisporangium aliadipatigenens]GIJ47143.1 hypothetical protein Val02_40290 [Virgisporangium aliadipatigenens]
MSNEIGPDEREFVARATDSGDAADASPAPPPELAPAAQALFGERLPLAIRYAELLMTDGVVRGLIGPREAPRIWERHILNCAAMSGLVSSGASIVDIGSGAGLPGIVLSVARPDLTITLIESLARRTAFLDEVVDELGLTGVTVMRARAEECVDRLPRQDYVTARAVAPLDRLTGWALPLLRTGGHLLALKGASAGEEVVEHAAAVRRLGGAEPTVQECGVGVIEPPAIIVDVRRVSEEPRRAAARRAATKERPASGEGFGSGEGRRPDGVGKWAGGAGRGRSSTPDREGRQGFAPADREGSPRSGRRDSPGADRGRPSDSGRPHNSAPDRDASRRSGRRGEDGTDEGSSRRRDDRTASDGSRRSEYRGEGPAERGWQRRGDGPTTRSGSRRSGGRGGDVADHGSQRSDPRGGDVPRGGFAPGRGAGSGSDEGFGRVRKSPPGGRRPGRGDAGESGAQRRSHKGDGEM